MKLVAVLGILMDWKKVVYSLAEMDMMMVFYWAAALAELMVSWLVADSVAWMVARMVLNMVVQ